MSSGFNKTLIAASISSVLAAPAVYATNGMNIEGYGPIAAGMGGASMAYENGSAATMNNPATLGLMNDGQSRLEVALGFLGPDVTASAGPMEAKSGGDAYYMPAVGWTKKEGKLSYGVGMFAQGGMGTEYEATSFMAAGTGEAVRSEVGVGRLLAPIAYNVNDNLTIGGTVDFVWAGMDLKMAMTGAQFLDFFPATFGGTQSAGTASGTMVSAFGGAVAAGQINGLNPVNTARFDFSNTNDFTGEATSTGYGGKIGFTVKEGKLTIGGTYHFKTSLADMETSNGSMSLSANFENDFLDDFTINSSATGTTALPVPVSGSVKVVDFQWPATLGVGLAYQASDKLMIAVDVKQIMWSDVMDSFRMSFTADATQANPLAAGFAGTSVDFEMYQNWKDQTAIQFGAAYKMDDALTLRAGMNVANNPVPDAYMNPLFPAIEENHITAGVGYKIGDNQGVDFALMHALDVTQDGGSGVTVSHSQMSWQMMYTYNF